MKAPLVEANRLGAERTDTETLTAGVADWESTPTLTVAAPVNPSKTTSSSVEVTWTLDSKRRNDIVRVNGGASADVALSIGENTIVVTVVDERGTERMRETIRVTRESPPPPPPPPAAVPSWAKLSQFQLDEAKRLKLEPTLEIPVQGLRFVLIPPGRFTMGSADSEVGRDPDEGPQHAVTLTQPYYLGLTEVTNGQYRKFNPRHDSRDFKGESLNGDDQPVVQVSHDDAMTYVAWLRTQDPAHEYRLPTEAEWEHACRSGTPTSRWWGDDDARTKDRASVWDPASKRKFGLESTDSFSFDDGYRVTSPVARFEANPWGLRDMLGNVLEWCADWKGDYSSSAAADPTGPASGSSRVLRGGSWGNYPRFVRSASRLGFEPDVYSGFGGFRLVVSARAR